jgi:hypothetical protein
VAKAKESQGAFSQAEKTRGRTPEPSPLHLARGFRADTDDPEPCLKKPRPNIAGGGHIPSPPVIRLRPPSVAAAKTCTG